MTQHISDHRAGFGHGLTPVTRFDEPGDNAGIGFAVLKLRAGEVLELKTRNETAWLMMDGHVDGNAGDARFSFTRRSLFDDSPGCVHVSAGTPVRIHAVADSELTVYETANRALFTPRVYLPADVPDEQRGKGQVGNRCLRLVRTIFDRRNTDASAELVLGEVVTLPGGWSSYPPHHHAQPEIYHYRFTAPQGYGHAELGEQVLKVRQFDTVKILAGLDHAQCAAPGYGMYYAWVIRHLPGNPYTVPEFTAEHRWTMEPGAPFWRPQGSTDD